MTVLSFTSPEFHYPHAVNADVDQAKKPVVVGATIEADFGFNLTGSHGITIVATIGDSGLAFKPKFP